MTPDEARSTVRRVVGWWAGEMTDAETLGWVNDLTEPHHAIQLGEAREALQGMHDSGATFRPRPGQVVRVVLDARRRNGRHLHAIDTPRSSTATAYYWLDKIRADNNLQTKLRREDRVSDE